MSIEFNPGFPLILGALLVMAAPGAWRAAVMAVAALASLWLLLFSEFGAADAFAQIGLEVVPRDLDALNRLFGIAFLIPTVLLSLYASARRNRFEDGAILLLAGGAVSALFVGDFLSLAAAMSLAGLAGAWVVMAAGGSDSSAAGVRLLIWHGIEGLLLLFGVAFHLWSQATDSGLHRLDAHALDGAFIFAALMIRIGAPGAHVWLKDAVRHSSGVGGAALSIYPSVLGIYGLARLFPAEPLLIPIGGLMIVIGLVYALAEDDLRRAGAYAQIAQLGVCAALIGVGSPQAVAGAGAHSFTIILAFALLQMAYGGVISRTGAAQVSQLEGLGRAMPVSLLLVALGGISAAGLPGLAGYSSLAVALEAVAEWDHRWLWLLLVCVGPGMMIALGLRPALAAFRTSPLPRKFLEARYPMLLATAMTGFFCISVGLSPSWLYRLTPSTALTFDPFLPERAGPQLEALGAAGCAFLALRLVGLAPKAKQGRLIDLDALYRGPMASGGRSFGAALLRLHGVWRAAGGRVGGVVTRAAARWSRSLDAPYQDQLSGAAQISAVCAILLIILIMRNF